MPKFAINPKTSQLHVFLLETLLGHKHGLTSVYYPPPSSEFILANVYMCTPLCTCLVQCVRQLVSYQTKKKGRAVLERKKKLPVSVCVLYVYTVVSMHAGVYPARPVMSALSGDSLINVWMFSSYLPQSLSTGHTLSQGTEGKGKKRQHVKSGKKYKDDSCKNKMKLKWN